MAKKLVFVPFLILAFFFTLSFAQADTGCNDGNYSLANTTYLSPQAGENNQNQINSAIASAPAGGSVFLKRGTYVINGPIKLKSNIILEGDKDAVIQLKDHANWKTIQYLGAGSGSVMDPILQGGSNQSNIEIKCFKIDGNYNFRSSSGGGNASSAFYSCIRQLGSHPWDQDFRGCESRYVDRWHGNGYYTLMNFNYANNISIHDMTLQDGANDGVKLMHSSNIRFYNNYVNAMGHEAVFAIISHGIEAYGNNVKIRASDAFRGDDCYDYSVHDNVMESYNHKDSSAGVQFDTRRGLPTYNLYVYKNVFVNIWNTGIWLSVGAIPMHNGKYPIEIHHNLFIGNGYSNNSAVGPTGGIVSAAGAYALIYNNTFDGNYGNGIYDSGGHARIFSNIITNTKAGKYSGAGSGIGVRGTVSYSCFYQNAGGDYTTGGTGNGRANPLYFNPPTDYHLMSMAGRWDPAQGQWTSDSQNSPCIDAGMQLSVDSVYGDYQNEPENNGDRVNAGAYGNTTQASLTGNSRQATMPPAPSADVFSTVTFTGGGSDSSTGGGSGNNYIPGTGTGGTGSGAFTDDNIADDDYDGPDYWDPGTSVLSSTSDDAAYPIAEPEPEAELAPLFPELGDSPETSTAFCSVVEGSAGLVPCERNTNDPATPWNECAPCGLCSVILMGQLTIEFLMKMAGIASTLAIVFAGFLYIFAAGKANHISKAKSMIKYTLMGFVIVFSSWVFVDTVLTILGYIDPLGGEWYTAC